MEGSALSVAGSCEPTKIQVRVHVGVEDL